MALAEILISRLYDKGFSVKVEFIGFNAKIAKITCPSQQRNQIIQLLQEFQRRNELDPTFEFDVWKEKRANSGMFPCRNRNSNVLKHKRKNEKRLKDINKIFFFEKMQKYEENIQNEISKVYQNVQKENFKLQESELNEQRKAEGKAIPLFGCYTDFSKHFFAEKKALIAKKAI